MTHDPIKPTNPTKPVIGVLALQGAFLEHEHCLSRLGIPCREIRQLSDLAPELSGLILPGGESSVQLKLLHDLHLFAPLQERIRQGLPVLATCAGLILLAGEVIGESRHGFQTLPVTVRRNAYGRQLGSFATVADYADLGPIEMRFIRAPAIESVQPEVQVLARTGDRVTAVQYQHQVAMAFHPELCPDLRIHQHFAALCQQAGATAPL